MIAQTLDSRPHVAADTPFRIWASGFEAGWQLRRPPLEPSREPGSMLRSLFSAVLGEKMELPQLIDRRLIDRRLIDRRLIDRRLIDRRLIDRQLIDPDH
jgi:hypothetical protein